MRKEKKDVIILTETWLTLNKSRINLPGYPGEEVKLKTVSEQFCFQVQLRKTQFKNMTKLKLVVI